MHRNRIETYGGRNKTKGGIGDREGDGRGGRGKRGVGEQLREANEVFEAQVVVYRVLISKWLQRFKGERRSSELQSAGRLSSDSRS